MGKDSSTANTGGVNAASTNLKVIKLQEQRIQRHEEAALAREETALMKTEIQKAKVEKQVAEENPELLWESEYKTLQNDFLLTKFSEIIKAVYTDNGRVHDQFGRGISANALAFADTRGLISFPDANRIELTAKGKFFAAKFLLQHPIL